MAEIGFYHLTRSAMPEALPRLLARTLAAGQRALVVAPTQASLDILSKALWDQPEWLPHGTEADGDADLQPIWLSTVARPANGSRFLFLVEGASVESLEEFERVFDLFDGNTPEAVQAARLRWQAGKQAGHNLTYWQQTEKGWQKKTA